MKTSPRARPQRALVYSAKIVKTNTPTGTKKKPGQGKKKAAKKKAAPKKVAKKTSKKK